jgi:site-specific DNA-cytosine methylase
MNRQGLGVGNPGEPANTITKEFSHGVAVAFAENSRAELRLCGCDGSVSAQLTTGGGKPGQGQACVAVAFSGDIARTLQARHDSSPCADRGMDVVAFKPGQSEAAGGTFVTKEFAPTLQSQNNGSTAVPAVQQAMAVRRLTPRECERLQGFPDDWTCIPWRGKSPQDCPDGPRYKALGNSMAVPCMAWIGKRIAAQHEGQVRYLSVCSGIEAASVAWEPLGWEPAAFAEVEKFPSAVLEHHWPQVPNMGDMTKFEEWNYANEESNKRTTAALELGDTLRDHGAAVCGHDEPPEESLRALPMLDGEAGGRSRSSDGPSARHSVPSVQCEATDSRGQRLGDAGVGLLERTRIDFAFIDLLVGGTPCQAFSVAGLRRSLEDERGNLSLTYIHLLDEIDNARAAAGRPSAICVWENVPGVLSTKDNAFGCFLGALAGSGCALQPPGERWANAGYVRGPKRQVCWRVLDAQYFGVAQRRRRVFVVANAGDRISPAEVLFEQPCLRWNPPARPEAGQGVAADAAGGASSSRGGGHSVTGAIDCRIGAQRAQNAQAGHYVAATKPVGALTANMVGCAGTPGYNETEHILPITVGALTDGAHQGGGLTDKMPTRAAYSPALANPLTARMGKGINTTLDEGQTPIVCQGEGAKRMPKDNL